MVMVMTTVIVWYSPFNKRAQHSVHPIGGSLRVFKQFSGFCLCELRRQVEFFLLPSIVHACLHRQARPTATNASRWALPAEGVRGLHKVISAHS